MVLSTSVSDQRKLLLKEISFYSESKFEILNTCWPTVLMECINQSTSQHMM